MTDYKLGGGSMGMEGSRQILLAVRAILAEFSIWRPLLPITALAGIGEGSGRQLQVSGTKKILSYLERSNTRRAVLSIRIFRAPGLRYP